MIPHSASYVDFDDFSFINEISKSNYVGDGVNCDALRRELSSQFSVKQAMLSSSGTSALELTFFTLKKLRPKARYIALGGYICPSVVNAAVKLDLKPIFLDSLSNSMNLDVALACEYDDLNLLALVCTNVAGIPEDYSLAQKLNCFLVSDCAQALGSTWDGNALLSYGIAATMSFGPTKMITAGMGGAVLSSFDEFLALANIAAIPEHGEDYYLQHGMDIVYGQNFSDVNASIAYSQLQKLKNFLNARSKISQAYTECLTEECKVELPYISPRSLVNNYRYYFFSDNAPKWIAFLRENGIDARSSIAHDVTQYFSGSTKVANIKNNKKRLVSLPIHPSLTPVNVEHILGTLKLGRGIK